MSVSELLDFLEDLKQNNNREWFLDSKKRYEAYKNGYHQLIEEMLAAMIPLDDSLKHLTVKDCAFRINRDIRFSKDKTPYKTHLPIWMSSGQKNTNLAGYYIHLEKGSSFIAGGVYWPEAADLKKIRKEVAFFHDDLQEIVNEKNFVEIFGQLDRSPEMTLKTAPKGYEKDHPAIEFLKLKCFTATHEVDDKLLAKPKLAETLASRLIALRPLNQFLNRALTAE
ncbi:MAG: DUF2461 domain-containing protein [Flavobacterium sp.]|nr:DUF2461 domain-containing protein [Flavobacterium sp.]